MSNRRLGNYQLSDKGGETDAIHTAVVSCLVFTGEYAQPEFAKPIPGASVRFVDDEHKKVITCNPSIRHGVIDPFLTPGVEVSSEVPVNILVAPNYVDSVSHKVKLGGILAIPEAELTVGAPTDEEDEEEDHWDDPACRGCNS